MRENIINTLKASFEASIQKHKLNIDIMLNKPMAIHEHTDFMGAVELELAQIAEYEDKLEALTKHFNV
jgi:hypothetical protein